MAERRFTVTDTPLAGLKLVAHTRMEDHRGSLQRLYCADELAAAGFDRPVAQINHTLTRQRGAVRGMHFQHAPHGEDKFVSVLRGEVLDVAVDLRRGSPTLGRWHGEVLSADNGRGLFIPRGFAHGFQTLTEECELLYLHSAAYHQPAEGAVNALDPALAITWPLPVTDMSARDRGHPPLPTGFSGIAT